MPRLNYALPIDTIRAFNPQITHQNLVDSDVIGNQDLEQLTARLEGVEADFERQTGHALREVRVGSEGAPGTYEAHDNKYWKWSPSTVYLNHRQIIPLDPAKGDSIELRVSRTRWRDITAQEGERWTADWRMGRLKIYSRLRRSQRFRPISDDRYIRTTYRYGGLGGNPTEGGQTTLNTDITDTQTGSVSVENASRLPSEGAVVLVGGSEYVRLTDIDPSADTVSIAERGLRGTLGSSHATGAVVHYCPMNVREGVAAQAARKLIMTDDWTDILVDTGEGVDPSTKLDVLETQWNNTVSRYAEMGYH